MLSTLPVCPAFSGSGLQAFSVQAPSRPDCSSRCPLAFPGSVPLEFPTHPPGRSRSRRRSRRRLPAETRGFPGAPLAGDSGITSARRRSQSAARPPAAGSRGARTVGSLPGAAAPRAPAAALRLSWAGGGWWWASSPARRPPPQGASRRYSLKAPPRLLSLWPACPRLSPSPGSKASSCMSPSSPGPPRPGEKALESSGSEEGAAGSAGSGR